MDKKYCPYCKEKINITAIKCRFCGEFIETKESVTKPSKSEPHSKRTILSLFLIVLFPVLLLLFCAISLSLAPDTTDNVKPTSILDYESDYESVSALEKYYSCSQEAYDNYIIRWNETCKNEGKPDDCSLSSIIANNYSNVHEDEQDRCVNQYASKIENSESLYNGCLIDAQDGYESDWNDSCNLIGLPDDCFLQSERSTELDDGLQREKDRCLKLFQL